jgi:hypothetical protein
MTITTFTGFTPIAEGQTGTAVATTLNSALSTVYGSYRYDFDNDDMISDALSYVHGVNTRNVTAELYDSTWKKQNIDGLFSLPSAYAWRLEKSSEIALTETFHLIVTYKPED